MAVSHNQFIQITDFQTYLTRQVLNVYYYRTVFAGGTGSLEMNDILDAFKDSIVQAVRALQHSGVMHTTLQGLNLSDGISIGEIVVNQAGTQTGCGQGMPSFVTATIRLIRSSAATRHGYKRYAGICESHTDGNTLVAEGGVAAAALAVLLAGDITVDTGLVIRPVIIKRPLGILPNPLESVYSDVASADIRNIGSQNTRKD